MSRITEKTYKNGFSTFFGQYNLKSTFLHKQEISEKKKQTENQNQILSCVWTYTDDWKLEFHIIIMIRIQILNLRRNTQGQEMSEGMSLPCLWSRFKVIGYFGKESCYCNYVNTITSNAPIWKSSQMSSFLELLL